MKIVNELKENNQDFEFYPTTDEILNIISKNMFELEKYYRRGFNILDIGCGLCKFKNYLKEKGNNILTYYVIEKSEILRSKFDNETICLGTDFERETLIDKNVDIIFCNPPYSKFSEWVIKILSEGNFKNAFLVIPERWKNNKEINAIIDHFNIEYEILGDFDFLNADRSARAKVQVVNFSKEHYGETFDPKSFDYFFDKNFKQTGSKEKNLNEKINTELKIYKENKIEKLVELYNHEYDNLFKNLNLIMQVDVNVLETFGINLEAIKSALKQKISSLKIIFWQRLFIELDEIKFHLTKSSCEKLLGKFKQLQNIDFTVENCIMFVKYILKIANTFYQDQIVDFFKKLSSKENVKAYKSNKKLFENENWRWLKSDAKNYVLDYRIIMSSVFRISYSGKLEEDIFKNYGVTLQDIRTIANNLGFYTKDSDWKKIPSTFGEKCSIQMLNGGQFMEYKSYKNNNMHVKFNKEFTKKLNVYVSRILGWIKNKDDIEKEFPKEFSGAEKYFDDKIKITYNSKNLLSYF